MLGAIQEVNRVDLIFCMTGYCIPVRIAVPGVKRGNCFSSVLRLLILNGYPVSWDQMNHQKERRKNCPRLIRKIYEVDPSDLPEIFGKDESKKRD